MLSAAVIRANEQHAHQYGFQALRTERALTCETEMAAGHILFPMLSLHYYVEKGYLKEADSEASRERFTFPEDERIEKLLRLSFSDPLSDSV